MSEKVLNAILQMFAILCRQQNDVAPDKIKYIRSFLKHRVSNLEIDYYFNIFINHLDEVEGVSGEGFVKTKPLDSVEIISICYKINDNLTRKQKIYVIITCLELFKNDGHTKVTKEILITCAEIFGISKPEFELFNNFAWSEEPIQFKFDSILILGDTSVAKDVKYFKHPMGDAILVWLKVPNEDLFYVRIIGNERIELNGGQMYERYIYSYTPGSVITTTQSGTYYYTDVLRFFQELRNDFKISFLAQNVFLKFSNGQIGLHPIDVVENEGTLVGIMGGSGSGKSSLIGVLSGLIKSTKGDVTLNGHPISTPNAKKSIGFVSQDDLLIEELTVYQNLYYNAKLIFKNISENQIQTKIEDLLEQLDLLHIKNSVVGSVHNKVISGGQRKRLNIGLELLRTPEVIFFDEPTSGLSSKDTENVMLLLSSIRNKGHLLFVVIHQPSSDVYKLFDKVILLDKGGYCIFQGNPIKAISYFKRHADRLSKDVAHCSVCGNVDSQEIFDIIEERTINELGIQSNKRTRTPEYWYEQYQNEIAPTINLEQSNIGSLKPKDSSPSKITQFFTYLRRDLNVKIRNLQYLTLLILEPVILALLLSFVIYRSEGYDTSYSFMKNENIPAYIFISIIVAVFIGISLGAEEIYKDRKILKREHFLGLSRMSYIGAKTAILFCFSAFQSILFVLIGNEVLEIEGNLFMYWMMVFTIACNSNLIGLIISSSFNSAITIYILIPLLVIPQLVLSGAIFGFDHMNKKIEDPGFAPLFAAVIPARWAYEGLMVEQFLNNEYQKNFNEFDRTISHLSYKNGAYLSKLYELVDELYLNPDVVKNSDDIENFHLLKNEMSKEITALSFLNLPSISEVKYDPKNRKQALNFKEILSSISDYYQENFNMTLLTKDIFIKDYLKSSHPELTVNELREKFQNKRVERIVRKNYTEKKMKIEYGKIWRLYEPVFIDNSDNSGLFRKYPYYSGYKYLLNMKFTTYWYNVMVIWSWSLFLFIILFLNLLKKLLNFSQLKNTI